VLDERLHFVRAMLTDLARLDAKREVFGASAHDYALREPLRDVEVVRFERRHGVKLPPDYRAFITQLGDGGAGPFYGVFALGKFEDDEPWKAGEFIGEPGTRFPYKAAWNAPMAVIDAVNAGDHAAEVAYHRGLDGIVPLVTEGCALFDVLVVTGPEAGHVWHDARTDLGGVVPWAEGKDAAKAHARTWSRDMLVTSGKRAKADVTPTPRARLSFLEWYERWLMLAAASVSKKR
jgi:hypothetical protein